MFYPSLFFAFLMGAIDIGALVIVKQIFSGALSTGHFIFPILMFALQPFIFYQALNYSNLAIMNILFDLSSNLIVTAISIYVLKEAFTKFTGLGLLFSFIAIFFFMYDDLFVR